MVWAPLHQHSHYSLLDGYSRASTIVEACKKYGYKSAALTDHGSISGCVEFFQECKKGDIKPILGCEFYVCDDVESKDRDLRHVVILAKNLQGWKELISCVSDSHLNFYYKPRVDYKTMKKYLGNGNHFCITGHPGTSVSESLFFSNMVYDANSYEEAKAFLKPFWKEDCKYVVDKYLDVFGENLFLEIQLIDQDRLHMARVVGECLRELGKELGIKTVATADSHYVYKKDAKIQRILIASALKLKMPAIEKAIKKGESVPLKGFFVSDNYHIPTPEEIQSIHTEEELNNSLWIADQCENYDILSKPILPRFSCPDNKDEFEYLKELCENGWNSILVKSGVVSKPEQEQKYRDRLNEELGVIKDAGLSGYFLIVQDIMNYIRSRGWLPGCGRGSAAGCLVSFLTGITSIDPIPYNLLFSRFYNASRKGSLPDIDMDMPSEHRDEVIEYVRNKYGRENVSQMVTFGRLQGRSAIKEVASVEDQLSFAEINAITEYIPDEAEISDELEEMDDKSIIRWALINRPEKFEKWCQIDESGKLSGEMVDLFEKAIRLEGTYKSQGKHAAGVIIAASPLANMCPMVRDSEGSPVVGFEMTDLEAIGQVKFDFLGVDVLTKIQKIAKHGNLNLSNLEDQLAWDLICSGETKGVFQLESKTGSTWAKKVKPRNIEEVSALVSLIRPGTLNAYFEGKSMAQHYVDRKSGKDEVKYLHPSLEPILKDTYGVLVYQEQSMLIAKEIAGFTEQEADNLRKAIGKKLADLMAKLKITFLEGCKNKGIVSETEAAQIFDWIEASNRYSFNKSHGVSYGVTAYMSAICKARNILKFYEVYLDHARRKQDTQEEIKSLIYDARVHNIEVYPPRIGNLYKDFTIIRDSVYYGISLVKDIGQAESEKIIELIQNSDDTKTISWIEILAKYSGEINKKAFIAMINTGFFEGHGRPSRNTMLYEYDIWRSLSDREAQFISSNIESTENLLHHLNVLVNNFKVSKPRLDKIMGLIKILQKPTNDLNDYAAWIARVEERHMGVAMTCCASDMGSSDLVDAQCKEIYQGVSTGPCHLGVTINTVKEFVIKKEGKNQGKKMVFLSVSDNTAILDSVIMFPDSYEKYKRLLYENNTVILFGQPSKEKNGGFIVDKVYQI